MNQAPPMPPPLCVVTCATAAKRRFDGPVNVHVTGRVGARVDGFEGRKGFGGASLWWGKVSAGIAPSRWVGEEEELGGLGGMRVTRRGGPFQPRRMADIRCAASAPAPRAGARERPRYLPQRRRTGAAVAAGVRPRRRGRRGRPPVPAPPKRRRRRPCRACRPSPAVSAAGSERLPRPSAERTARAAYPWPAPRGGLRGGTVRRPLGARFGTAACAGAGSGSSAPPPHAPAGWWRRAPAQRRGP